MKKLVLALALASVSVGAFAADKIVIKGEPVVIEKQGDVYITPATTTLTTTEDHYFFTVNNTKQVCYRDVQPGLAKVDLGLLAVRIGTDNVSLHCYSYSPDYFVVS